MLNNFGRTLATATALACSGVCRPICPNAHEAAALNNKRASFPIRYITAKMAIDSAEDFPTEILLHIYRPKPEFRAR